MNQGGYSEKPIRWTQKETFSMLELCWSEKKNVISKCTFQKLDFLNLKEWRDYAFPLASATLFITQCTSATDMDTYFIFIRRMPCTTEEIFLNKLSICIPHTLQHWWSNTGPKYLWLEGFSCWPLLRFALSLLALGPGEPIRVGGQWS